MSSLEPDLKVKRKHENPAMPLLLAVVGSVAGTLVCGAISHQQELDPAHSQNLALLGAALGAAIPPIVAIVGPFTQLRLGAGVVISIVALIVTYGGFNTHAKVAGDPPTFPPILSTPTTPTPTTTTSSTTEPSPTESPTTTTPPTGHTCEGALCIDWAPTLLLCTTNPCTPDVVVHNTGTERLRISGLLFTGSAAGGLSQSGTCSAQALEHDQTCSVTVHVKPGTVGHAQLRIQQNLSGPASIVDLDVGSSTPPAPSDLDLSLGTLQECQVVPDGFPGGGDVLSVLIPVNATGPGALNGLVPFKIVSDTGLSGEGHSGVSTNGSVTAMQVALGTGDYDRDQRFTLTLDPDNAIAETDETNNTEIVTVKLPQRPTGSETVECSSP